MRIDPTLTVTPIAKDPPKAQAPAPATGRARTRRDVVSLSAAATGTHPPDMTARISEIKSQLAKGTYPIDLDKLALRITEEDLK